MFRGSELGMGCVRAPIGIQLRRVRHLANGNQFGEAGLGKNDTANYDSGSDYLLEFGDLKYSFNEEDFAQRAEQAARRLRFIEDRLAPDELSDLVRLTVNGELSKSASALGDHVVQNWAKLVGPSDRSLVYWLRRLVFRSAYLDQKVKMGELDIEFHEQTRSFGYVDRERGVNVVDIRRQPSWRRVSYRRASA